MILALHPDLVHMELAEPGYMGDPGAVRAQLFREGTRAITANGILGDPRPGDAERGRDYLEAMTNRLTDFFTDSIAAGSERRR